MRAIGKSIAAIWWWLGGPWRSFKALAVVLVNLSRQQMRALFSIAMLGGIIALSFQNIGLIWEVKALLGQAKETLFGEMVLAQQFWNNVIIMVFCVSLALIVFGADYFRAKYGDAEFSAGRGAPDPHQQQQPIPASIDTTGQIRPDSEMV